MWKWLRGTPALLARSLRDAEWRPLLDFVTPAFFDVMPARALLAQGRTLVANARDPELLHGVVADVRRALEDRKVAVQLDPAADPPARGATDDLDEAERRRRGQSVLEIYFAQLLGSPASIVDLRPERFARGPETLWRPGPYFVAWEPTFVDSLRRLYRGFYREDETLLAGALADLQLTEARELLLRHLGEGDQRAVHFDRRHFQATFHDVFVRCKERKIQLHPNFLPLGILLATLHDHLALLGLGFDVRDAFERADAV